MLNKIIIIITTLGKPILLIKKRRKIVILLEILEREITILIKSWTIKSYPIKK